MSNWGLELEQLSIMGALARDAASAPVDPDVHREGRDRIVGIAATTRYRQRSRARTYSALAMAAVLAGGVVFWLVPRPLRYEVVGGSGFESPYVSAPQEAPVDLRFSDGSDMIAEAGSRLRVDATYSHGARVLLENGGTSTHVAHHKMSNWTFVAGPFEVRVIGTRFDLHWDPVTEQIDLRLREGSVEVRSPLADGPIVVRAGQRFRAAMPQRSMTVTDADTLEAQPETPPSTATPAAAAPISPPSTGAASPRQSARRESWQELITHGEFESVVSAANARGIDGCLASCVAADLRSLADAARYTGRNDLADKTLLSLRKRFPGTSQSAAAAFLLGHSHESRSLAAAERWYETYLYESPEGEFAAEALAGKMRVIAKRSGDAAAKPLALEYLRRYPQGVQVKTARKIAGLD
jgi:hypothetical protein